MKENLKSKRGITLIALIITIIILLILAMVTINILINQGIIGHANNAVRGYEVAEEKELISLAYQNYKMDKLNDSSAELTVDGATALRDEEINGWYITFTKTNHNYTLTEDGSVATAEERWVKTADGYKKGDAVIHIGDYVEYDPTKDANGNTVTATYTSYKTSQEGINEGRANGGMTLTYKASDYTKGWRVLGIKGNNIELIAAQGEKKMYILGQDGHQYGVEELQAATAVYGHGKGAIGARNLTVEEVNEITGYDPENPADGKPCQNGCITEYGNEVTCYWKGDDKPYFVGSNGKTSTASNSYSDGFYWFDGNEWHHSDVSETATNTATGREKIVTLKITAYSYYPTTLTENSSGEVKGLANDSAEYKLLFANYSFWLASRSHYSGGYFMYTAGYMIGGNGQYGADGSTNYHYDEGIRPVVTLASNVQLKTDATHDGSARGKGYLIEIP